MSSKPNKRTYPYYGKLQGSEQVVLFTAPQTGTVVTPAFDEFGYYCETWDESSYTVVVDEKSITIGKRVKQLCEIQREALRLMNLAGTIGRHMAKNIGITHQAYSDIKQGRKPFSDTQARAIVRAFGVFARTVTPRVQDTDAD